MADGDVKRVKELIAKKDEIEKQIKEFQEVLESQKGVGMDGNLVDSEGFPRSDIDVYTVRIARNKIICLQNDHKALMKEIEDGLHQIHAMARENEKEEYEKPKLDETADLVPFLKVGSVTDGSPACQAGLQKKDKILKFGSLTHKNFQGMQNVASVVEHSKGNSMPIILLRNEQKLRLSLIPNPWSGRGLLGCHVLPA
ncbi:26S proteasome non-ATPase regulatory subunit 9-like [Actinia tenebrosa]|uniref:26S proteasome non-ATPase regulatory subunit 9-like n=1 Tax=Actinia tenebrosa TaxID=6105 RepID=A0A6P8IN69_ACTTE|nr:26S proteasome non-ATPase regulatory subunit 9-like [Actinia tenebrosa]